VAAVPEPALPAPESATRKPPHIAMQWAPPRTPVSHAPISAGSTSFLLSHQRVAPIACQSRRHGCKRCADAIPFVVNRVSRAVLFKRAFSH
jgi:hypothetical protein